MQILMVNTVMPDIPVRREYLLLKLRGHQREPHGNVSEGVLLIVPMVGEPIGSSV